MPAWILGVGRLLLVGLVVGGIAQLGGPARHHAYLGGRRCGSLGDNG